MVNDPWHYPRDALAEQVLGMFETGLSSALVFFAPRRMGKTEFLRKDIMPLAEKRGWKVFYFSFLDVGSTVTLEFTHALASFAEKGGKLAGARRLLGKVSKISGEAAGIKAEVEISKREVNKDLKEILARLASKHKVLLLLDEVQAIAQNPANANFVAALRTVLDMYKDNVKVIFMGSSQEGLRLMFSQAKAPFFHFGQNLPFPELDRGFTNHLAHVFEKVTKRKLDVATLWAVFEQMQKIPQLARSLVEQVALNPGLTLEQAQKKLQSTIFADRAFADVWEHCSALERLLLREIAAGVESLYSVKTRYRLARALGVEKLEISSVQSASRVLQRKGLIGRLPERGGYFIDDPNLKGWLLQ